MAGYILVVDDDAGLREAVACDLEALGHRTRQAADGAEALEQARGELPMLVLTDLEMPVMNGRKMLQLLRREPLGGDVPVIVLSAFGFEWEAELMGAQAFVRKPVNSARLRETIAHVLTGGRLPDVVTH
jgi:CheY-like chemotaxis protein